MCIKGDAAVREFEDYVSVYCYTCRSWPPFGQRPEDMADAISVAEYHNTLGKWPERKSDAGDT